MSDLARLEAAAAGLESLPDDAETADYIGRLDKVIRTLQGHRKTIMDELPGPVSGKEYRVVEERFSERSYNTYLLKRDFEDAGLDLDSYRFRCCPVGMAVDEDTKPCHRERCASGHRRA